jgi:hypothetical protein
MPKVGGKEFSYTPEGIVEARAESAKTGVPMEVHKRYEIGGLLKKSGGPKVKRTRARGCGAATKGTDYRVR